VFDAGSNRPPVIRSLFVMSTPPHTTIRVPVQTAACMDRAVGVPAFDMLDHASAAGS
jgi:hypothetical protein